MDIDIIDKGELVGEAIDLAERLNVAITDLEAVGTVISVIPIPRYEDRGSLVRTDRVQLTMTF